MRETRRGRRNCFRFRPLVDVPGGGMSPLEPRLLLSVTPMAHDLGLERSRPSHAPQVRISHEANGRIGPAAEIHKQYNAFYTAFRNVEASYVRSLSEQSSGTVSVSTNLTAPFAAGSATMQVADAGVFGPEGVFPTPVTATAIVGSVPAGTFTLTGSSGNQLVINTAQSSAVNLDNGTALTAEVTSTASTSAGSIFPSYIAASSQQLADNLVRYFDSLPIKLPRMYSSSHYPQRAGALQQFVYQVVDGSTAASLERTLASIPLPQTPGGDLRIYDAAVQAAIDASRQRILGGVQQIFANKMPVIPIGFGGGTSPGSSGASSSGGSTGASATSGTGSTSSSSNTNLSTVFVP